MVACRDWNVAQIPQSALLACTDYRCCRPLGGSGDRGHSDRTYIGLYAKSSRMDREGMSSFFRVWVLIFIQHDQFFGGSDDAFVREISFINPATQEATITSVNLSLSQFATCYESIRYSPTTDGRHTTFHQTAEVQARMALWRSVADKLENWLVQRFEQNAQLGKVGFTDVLKNLWEAKQQQLAHS